ncbi:MAG TPA: cob(I)yrinic acid a,c-diamide adenosyltransferase [Thermomicrobiales bacterium]|nr:cob(I)yrinic acid a,c-diamide adenosyltransferase [Thermomicrobiales bacterium]
MRIYTAKGDKGSTDLLGERVSKDDPRIDLIGILDESTSSIGLGRAQATLAPWAELLIQAQRDLYQIMAELAFVDELRPDAYRLPAERVTWLEESISTVESTVSLPPQFVVPGDTVAGAALDVARTVVRRAERLAVHLDRAGRIPNPEILRYLNRLSSLLFIVARAEDLATNEGPRLAKGR